LALGVVLLGATSVMSQPAGEDKAFEKSLDDGLRKVIDLGANVYNKQGDYAGCFRLYEGALMAVRPTLSKYPELQKAIDDGIDQAYALNRIDERAHVLRAVLGKIRMTFNPNLKPAPTSLWDRLGGEAGVSKVISELMDAAGPDPKVNFDRGKYKMTKEDRARVQKSLLDFVSQATGGPYKYSGPSMKKVHEGMGITNAEFDALAGHLKKVLEKNSVKADDIKLIMEAVGSTRKDIVEPKEKLQPPDDKKNKEPEPQLSQVSGKVLFKGQPVANASVVFVDAKDKRHAGKTNADGTYALDVQPGEYRILLEARGHT
jgi:hemoglobin